MPRSTDRILSRPDGAAHGVLQLWAPSPGFEIWQNGENSSYAGGVSQQHTLLPRRVHESGGILSVRRDAASIQTVVIGLQTIPSTALEERRLNNSYLKKHPKRGDEHLGSRDLEKYAQGT